VDYLVKYKLGAQLWYVQSRMRENPPKGNPIPGFPMNQKARDAKRYYKIEKDDGEEEEFNAENDPSTHWQKEWQQPAAGFNQQVSWKVAKGKDGKKKKKMKRVLSNVTQAQADKGFAGGLRS